MSRWADEQMSRWADEQMNRWADEQMNRWTDDQMNRWTDEQMNRWTDEQTDLLKLRLLSFHFSPRPTGPSSSSENHLCCRPAKSHYLWAEAGTGLSSLVCCGQGQETTLEWSTWKLFHLGRLMIYMQKHYTILERLGRHKHSISLFVIYSREKFCNIGPCQKLLFVSRGQEPYSQHFILFITYELAQ